MNLLINEATSRSIKSFLNSPSHALVMQGAIGGGKPTTALHITQELIGVEELDNYPYFLHIKPADNTISIDEIRKLQKFLSLTTTGEQALRRAIIIEDAETMGKEAQNALLKMLEEPPTDTILILTTSDNTRLLPTILSRCQVIIVRPLAKTEAEKLFANKPSSDVSKAFHISGGNVGLMSLLLDEETEHPLKNDIETAKKLLSSSTYERLLQIDKPSKNKAALPSLLYALKRLYRAVLEQSALRNNLTDIKKAQKALQAVLNAELYLSQGGSPKLLLDELMLNI